MNINIEISVKCWNCQADVSDITSLKKGTFKLICKECETVVGEVKIKKRTLTFRFPLLVVNNDVLSARGARGWNPIFVVRKK
jgi:hypothetical protein